MREPELDSVAGLDHHRERYQVDADLGFQGAEATHAPLSVKRARTSEMASVVSSLYTQARVAELSTTKLTAGPHPGPP
jgi:hypothetical protein